MTYGGLGTLPIFRLAAVAVALTAAFVAAVLIADHDESVVERRKDRQAACYARGGQWFDGERDRGCITSGRDR